MSPDIRRHSGSGCERLPSRRRKHRWASKRVPLPLGQSWRHPAGSINGRPLSPSPRSGAHRGALILLLPLTKGAFRYQNFVGISGAWSRNRTDRIPLTKRAHRQLCFPGVDLDTWWNRTTIRGFHHNRGYRPPLPMSYDCQDGAPSGSRIHTLALARRCPTTRTLGALVVEPTGLEPATSCPPDRRDKPGFATARWSWDRSPAGLSPPARSSQSDSSSRSGLWPLIGRPSMSTGSLTPTDAALKARNSSAPHARWKGAAVHPCASLCHSGLFRHRPAPAVGRLASEQGGKQASESGPKKWMTERDSNPQSLAGTSGFKDRGLAVRLSVKSGRVGRGRTDILLRPRQASYQQLFYSMEAPVGVEPTMVRVAAGRLPSLARGPNGRGRRI